MKIIRYLTTLTLALAAAVAHAEAPSDSQIAEIVIKANQVDVDAGRLALTKGSQADVKSFAREMVMAHTSIAKQAMALVTRLKITPEPSLTSHSLEGGGAANVELLSRIAGAEFDRAYVGHEVAYHQQVLQAVDQVLIPGARNPDLAALLRAARPIFVAHLEHARRLRDAL